ncbi:serine hydrolase [Flavobacterium hydrocarbonoxydans]|nr:serine hydrolase [Flavobacterium hydrocarbonoxydans]
MEKPDYYELQIIYTQITRDKKGKIHFKDYTYNLDAKNYYCPASTVKFPIAVLALEKLNTFSNTSINTQYSIEEQLDKVKFSEEITKLFAVSDNVASTKLLEFTGFDYVNQKMHDKGLEPFRLSHRLSAPDSGNPLTKSITLYKDDNTTEVIPAKMNQAVVPLSLNKIKKGVGHLDSEDKLVNTPYDFSKKNYYPLETLHNTLKRIVFPKVFKENERFKLTEKDREFILFSMQNLPKNAGYDPVEYYDGYCKFFMFGDTKENIPDNIKIYNKIGQAYGNLTDSAYIVDKENGVEFMVSATLYVNEDGILNDNKYEYDTIGLPFLAELGRQLYAGNKKL